MRKSPSLWASVMLIGVLLLAAGRPALAQSPWRVGTWKTAQTIQPFFYQQFLPGQKLEVFPFTNPADQKMALLAGSLDMCGTTLAHAIHSASRGEPVVVVAALCNKCSALVVQKDSPIQSIKDLAGKKIGYVPGTMHEILLREALTKNGINPNKDVKLVRVDFFDMGLALARGSIDAFLSGEPFPTLAVLQGYGRILAYPYYGGGVGAINAGMLVTKETIDKHPQLVAALVAAHAASTEYLKTHPKQWLQRAATFGTPLKVLEKAAPNMELAWNMDQGFIKRVRALGGRMKALGIISREPDYHKLIDLSFVKGVKLKN
ncbi:MAG: NrtA/SsuA/CpmA family ABC transporter substrate-binding protein [Proteobacteria bacterium]|nr:NrtA/SsuA/CpmA family ABC transporter substrate-binding protein [Pseudomonadota bacterium]MBU1452477.1 NrtA/SsuA/CpmA family ABC transporter substrate-binding protein [Pseudomonadota bacterium]MBU2468285.1 NrtA/SsuA/CpmA family ABC transporter substrate-binding protein [Pseudomonadota bacterium]MBU2518157.1 NrtA/SsuA/CpmA family ABC transporter substrate-binding protein [Pseudomonadota bacterium]